MLYYVMLCKKACVPKTGFRRAQKVCVPNIGFGRLKQVSVVLYALQDQNQKSLCSTCGVSEANGHGVTFYPNSKPKLRLRSAHFLHRFV